VSSLEEIEFMDIQSMEYPRIEDDQNICNYSYQPHPLTVVIGAVCLEGIVLIADKKLTNTIGEKHENPGIKIYGELEHILIGYTGAVNFDTFRKHVVGDVITTRAFVERYKYDNVVQTMSTLIKEFNDSIGRQHSVFEMLIAKHIGEHSQLHHIDIIGKDIKLDHKAIGIGKDITDIFCKKIIEDGRRPKIKEFVKAAYIAIMYMERFCPGMGVGVGEDIPKIKYLYHNQPTDYEEIPSVFTEECKNQANDELRKMTEAFEALK
jgi:20S proteasome alpha/beta subunit